MASQTYKLGKQLQHLLDYLKYDDDHFPEVDDDLDKPWFRVSAAVHDIVKVLSKDRKVFLTCGYKTYTYIDGERVSSILHETRKAYTFKVIDD